MRVAITGASGFVGRHAVQEFLEEGYEVVAVGRDLVRLQGTCGQEGVRREQTDYSRVSLAELFAGVEAVVHLAARRGAPSEDRAGFAGYYEANVRVTENAILAAGEAGVHRFCLASSIAVYSPQNSVPFSESEPPVPLGLYGVSKLACEHLAAVYGRWFPMGIICLRLAQVFGWGERQGLMVTTFCDQARQAQTLRVWGQGATERDHVYVRDVVGAIRQALAPRAPSGVFNIGAGRPISVLEVAEAINSAFDNEGNLVLDLTKAEALGSFYMDTAKAETELGWKRQWTLGAAFEEMAKAEPPAPRQGVER